MQRKLLFSAALLLLGLFLTISASPLTNLAKTITPSSNSDDLDPFEKVTIDFIDDDYINWIDSEFPNRNQEKHPLFIYEAPSKISWLNPSTSAEGHKAKLSFLWCETEIDNDDCTASMSVPVQTVDMATPGANSTVEFKIPTLAWTKFMPSIVRFSLTHLDENNKSLGVYTSKYNYPSDFASKTTKGVIIVVVIFCTVCILMALAVLGFFIFKKVKKSRRQRHFPNQAGGHNLWRRS
jgi:hypothetical protein